MRIVREIAKYLVGGLFIFSGIIKINDPIGTAIKLEEYFHVFAADIAPFFEIFVPAALFLSVFLSVLEVVLGTSLLVGYRINVTSVVLLITIVFFTFLTFYSAYFNKVTDCGCFGDAIKLTPWQSFYKDIILLILILIIFFQRHFYKQFFANWFQTVKVVGVTIFMTGFAIYAIRHLPFIDFRAYKIGNHLPSLMVDSEPLKYAYILEKDGERFEFNQYPSEKGYEFIETKLLNPEAEAKITDLNIWQGDNEFTEDMMQGNKLLIVIHDIDKTSLKKIDNIRNLCYQNPNYETWILTSTGPDRFEPFRHQHQLPVPYFFADATVLKAMVRSNPGIITLSNGKVKGKWHFNDTPIQEEILESFNK